MGDEIELQRGEGGRGRERERSDATRMSQCEWEALEKQPTREGGEEREREREIVKNGGRTFHVGSRCLRSSLD